MQVMSFVSIGMTYPPLLDADAQGAAIGDVGAINAHLAHFGGDRDHGRPARYLANPAVGVDGLNDEPRARDGAAHAERERDRTLRRLGENRALRHDVAHPSPAVMEMKLPESRASPSPEGEPHGSKSARANAAALAPATSPSCAA